MSKSHRTFTIPVALFALLSPTAQAAIGFLSGVALPNGGEILSFTNGTLFSTDSIGGATPNHQIASYALTAGGTLTPGISINLNSTFGATANTANISSVLADSRGFGVATVIPTATGASDFGRIAFFNTSTGTVLHTLNVGYHPDSVTITPDGTKLLVTNEAEFVSTAAETTFARPGSISIVNLTGVTSGNFASAIPALTSTAVNTIDFSAGNLASGVTINGLRNHRLDTLTVKTANAADIEPEYTVASNTTAYVTLQEANAIATLDLATGKYTALRDLGALTRLIDASDMDGPSNGKAIAINDTVKGLPMPDTVAKFTKGSTTYLATANEGDARPGDGDVARGSTLTASMTPAVAALAVNTGIGQLNLIKDRGDTNNDGLIDDPTMLGTRSFSVWNADTGTLVFDSAAMIEQFVAANNPASFNMNNGQTSRFDERSDDKGPEPEAIAYGSIGGRDFIFVGNERENGIFQFDITDLNNVFIADYFNPITGTTDGAAGGAYISPESILFLDAASNPTGKNLLIVGFEGTGGNGSIGVFEVNASAIPEPSTYAALAGVAMLGFAALRRRTVRRA